MNIDKEIRYKISLIVDRYLQLKTSFKNIKKYLLGKGFNIILNDLLLIEEIYFKQNTGKNFDDFKKLVKNILIILLKDRQYYLLDKQNNESLNYLKSYENYKNDNLTISDNGFSVIDIIKNKLIEYYDSGTWEHFIDNQEMGECQSICNTIINNVKIDNVNIEKHFGEIEIDDDVYFVDNDEYVDKLTHHWITIDNEIYEFSKGTLKDYIKYDDIYDVENVDDWRYESY